jgi:hypothetical protein
VAKLYKRKTFPSFSSDSQKMSLFLEMGENLGKVKER